MRLAAAVVTFNRPDGVRRVVDALAAQTRPPDEVIVVNNGEPITIDGATLIDAGANTGAAGGFAIALDHATANDVDWLYLLNDDDAPASTAIEVAVSHIAPGVVAVGACVESEGRRLPFGSRLGWRRIEPTADELAAATHDVDLATFNGLLVHVPTAVAVGGIRADLFMMWEEYDLCLRLRRRGRIVVDTRPLVDIGARHAGTYPAWRAYYGARNGVLVLRSHPKALPWFLAREAKMIAAAVRRPEHRRARVRGLWHGALGRSGRTVEPT